VGITLISLLDVAPDLQDASDLELSLLQLCVTRRLPVFVAVPSGAVAITYDWVKENKSAMVIIGEDANGQPVKAPIGSVYPIKPVANTCLDYVALDTGDLARIRDASLVVKDWFAFGLEKSSSAGYDRTNCGQICLYRISRFDLRAKYPIDSADAVRKIAVTVRFRDLFVEAGEVPGIIGELSSVVDRWGHREAAPSVFLIYRAAHLFAGSKYDFDTVRGWLVSNDRHKVFKDKIARFAAWLIKPNAVIKSKKRKPPRLARERIANNPMGRNYAEQVASDRLSLLLLATDCWLHDRKHPDAEPMLPQAGLDALLYEMGFEASVNNPKECQVEYLRRVIENIPSSRHAATEKNAAAKTRSAPNKKASR
jgi:hypothetical protein